MLKNRWNIILVLTAIILACSITGLAQYTYTQQSGTGYFVSEADKSDALEDTNEVRMILDELGLLLKHSKYGDASYPADENTTPGTLDVFDDYLQDITAESIGDLSDVSNVTPSDGHVLIYDGTVDNRYENRALVEADISDLGTTVAMVADKLSVFASTTSSELAGVISDETGSGALVFGTSPTLTNVKSDGYLDSDTNTFFGKDVAGAGVLSHTTGSEGYSNTFMGNCAGYSNTTGYSNTFMGNCAGYSNTTGYYNTFMGLNAGYNVSQKVDAVNSMALGYNTYTTADNQVIIGNASINDLQFGQGGKLGKLTGVASAVNYLEVTNSATTNPVKIEAKGSDANISINLVPKGTGAVELGGELDAGAHSIGFTLQTITADGTDNIDWRLGNHCKVTLGAQNETFTFTAPSNPCNLTLIIIQDSTGGRDIIFPASVRWLGDEPTWTDGGANKGIIVGFLYDGTNYWAQATPYEN